MFLDLFLERVWVFGPAVVGSNSEIDLRPFVKGIDSSSVAFALTPTTLVAQVSAAAFPAAFNAQ